MDFHYFGSFRFFPFRQTPAYPPHFHRTESGDGGGCAVDVQWISGGRWLIKCDLKEFRRNFDPLKLLVETPMRVKDAPLTLRGKLRTSFALSYQLLRLISICGLAAVSMAFRANSGLAFSAKPIGVALAQPLCRHRSLNRMRTTKFFEEP